RQQALGRFLYPRPANIAQDENAHERSKPRQFRDHSSTSVVSFRAGTLNRELRFSSPDLTARQMPLRSKLRSASNSDRSPCSMKRSGMPKRKMWRVSKPALLAASKRALPKPPSSVPSSTVTQ